MVAPTAVLFAEARAWVADCVWADDPAADELSEAELVSGIDRHYVGGWAAFTVDAARLEQ